MALEDEVAKLRSQVAELRELVAQTRSLVGPFGVPMPDGSMLTQTIHGLIYYIDPTDTIMAPQMLVYRQWEADLSSLMSKLLSTATTFVDVGANFGYFTCLGAHLLARQAGSSVIAIEPNPKLARLLRRNVEINWSSAPVTIIEAAAGGQSGNATLFIPKDHGANAGLTDSEGADRVDVRLVRVDDVVPSDQKVDVLKIDVEGHELGVLQGAAETIRRNPSIKIVVEWSPAQMKEAGADPRGFQEFFGELGLLPFQARSALPKEPLTWDALLALGYDNILFQAAS